MTRRHLVLVLSLAASLLLGCDGDRSGATPSVLPPAAEATVTLEPGETQEATEAREAAPPAPRPPAPSEDAARSFASANNRFAAEFWAHVREAPGNQIVSPASISLALAMTYAGADGDTATEMASTMHFDALPGGALHDAAGGLLAQWNDPDRESYRLAVVNRLFGEETYAFEAPFLELTRTRYRAPLEATDFRGAPEPARVHINGWVAEQTRDRIQDLIPAGGVDALTRLALVNAVYFLGQWVTPFPADGTGPEPFHVGGGVPVDVPMMRLSSRLHYTETDTVQVVQLPYQGDDVAMVLIVPRAEDGLAAVSAGLTAETLNRWVGALRPGQVALSMPRVRVAPEEPLELSAILQSMGMEQAFERGAADFTSMGNPSDPAERLFLSAVFHKAFVDIDERGTEAAAATAVVIRATGGGGPPPPAATVTADRPYLFLIRDVRSGTVLFMGRVVDPR